MKILVIDTETTDIGDEDEVVEVAVVTVTEYRKTLQMTRWHSLVRPTHSRVSFKARATHHITDDMLAVAPTLEELMPKLERLLSGDAWASHFLAFDKRMLLQSGLPAALLPAREICTWRCGLHLWPDADSHSNQVLRYFLGLEPPRMSTLPPHRALPDAIVTAALLIRMLTEKSVDELADLTTQPALLHRVRHGKHYGKLWSEMDAGYCRWILANFGEDQEDVRHTARHHLQRLSRLRAQRRSQSTTGSSPASSAT